MVLNKDGILTKCDTKVEIAETITKLIFN